MDKNRFDRFTRQLAKRENRRTAIKTLFAGGVGTAATVLVGGETGAAKSDCCPSDHPTLCGLTCIDTITSAENCGACGHTCAVDERCYKGICESASALHCAVASDCPTPASECLTRTCIQGICGNGFAASGKKVTSQTAGDCQRNVCDGAGNVTSIADNTDKPAASGECTIGICFEGVPHQNALPAGRRCTNGKCDGAGHCSGSAGGCTSANDCPPTGTECAVPVCTNGVCGTIFVADGVGVTAQTAGDCKQTVCDGAGGTKIVDDDTDIPVAPNDCVSSVCTAGVLSNPPKASNTSCPGGVCDGAGVCVQCIIDSQCAQSGNECEISTCQSGTCISGYAPAGTSCANGICDGYGDCVGCTTPVDCAGGVLPHATVTCTSGMCGYYCDADWGDCNPGSDGCDTYLLDDPQNCGGCGTTCPPLPNAVVICANGACGFVGCDPGYLDCNLNPADGCEVLGDSDPDNCGMCGNVCATGQRCVDGACQ